MGRDFTSDNVLPVCAPIMEALHAANAGVASSYGADQLTRRLQSVANEVFETETAIFPVSTGSAANGLALSQIAPPYGAVYCHEAAHIVTDECGGPEFFTGGARLIGLPSPDGRIAPGRLAAAIAFANEMGVHHAKPAAVSVTQATECGTVYEPSAIASIAAVARQHRLPLHMDGARFANALVHLGCSAAEATWKSGVDVLSLGATKNGSLCAEAVVFFDPARAADFERRCKRAGHLWSKQRFLSAQLLTYLEGGLWLDNARHANAMARRLSQGLERLPGVRLAHPVEANEIFVVMPEAAVAALEARQFAFYRWPLCAADDGVAVRLVTSYATRGDDVDALVAAAAAVMGGKHPDAGIGA